MKIIFVIARTQTQFHWGFVYPLLSALRDCKIKYKYKTGKQLDIFCGEEVSYILVRPYSLRFRGGSVIDSYKSLIPLEKDEEEFLKSLLRSPIANV